MSDTVNHPSYYTDGKIEVIEYIEDKKLGYCLGNAIKYISRAGKKDKEKEIEDLQKADWYIKRRIQELESWSERREYDKAIDDFVKELQKKIEKDLANNDLALECKKCGIWKNYDIEEIAEQLKAGDIE